jgi:polysaccharide pyruvyl transferase WcaK-like protein
LRAHIPDAEFTLWSPVPRRDSARAEEYGVRIIGTVRRELVAALLRSLLWFGLRKLGVNSPRLLRSNDLLKEYCAADAIVDILGISFSDYFSRWIGTTWAGCRLLMGKLLGKPVVKFTQDMGPFRKRATRCPARFFLSRVDLIIARSTATQDYLKGIGVTAQVHLRPDSAFVLDPSPADRIDSILLREKLDKRPLVGMTVTTQIDRRLSSKDREADNRYTALLAQMADYLIDTLDALVVFIPNETEGGYDDVYVAKNVCKNVKNKGAVRLVTTEYGPEELKGLIGKCDLLIGSRYHSIVAALSMCVPCLVIGWGHKYNELMGIVGQTEFVCDFQAVSFEEARAKVDRLWRMREEIRGELASRVPSIKERVLSSGKLVRDLLRTSNLT